MVLGICGSMVQGNVTTRPLLVKHTTTTDDISAHNGGGGDGDSAATISSSSRVTALLVLSTIVAAIGSFSHGFAAGYSAPAETGIISELGLSIAEYSFFGSALTIGALMGALLSGKVADFFGRRITMWILNIFYISGWLSIIFSKSAWLLDIGRLSIGIGVGLVSYVGNIYIAEVTPKNLRGGFMTLSPLMTGSSTAFAYLIGSIVNWRSLALIGSISCVLQIFGLIFIPESPRWLVKNGKEEQFEAALQCLRGQRADISEEAAAIKSYTEELQLISEDRILDLLQKKYAYAITVGVGLMVLQQFTGLSGVQFYVTTIFDLAGVSSRVGYIIVAVVKILMNTLGIFLIDKLGRKSLLMVAVAGTCLGSFILGSSFLFQDLHWWKQATPLLALTGVLVFMGAISIGLGGIPWIIVSEIFPINVKGSAGSLCNSINWFCSWVVTYTFNFSLEWSSAGTFFLFSSISGFGFVFITLLVPETKRRTLEEIQASITGSMENMRINTA